MFISQARISLFESRVFQTQYYETLTDKFMRNTLSFEPDLPRDKLKSNSRRERFGCAEQSDEERSSRTGISRFPEECEELPLSVGPWWQFFTIPAFVMSTFFKEVVMLFGLAAEICKFEFSISHRSFGKGVSPGKWFFGAWTGKFGIGPLPTAKS